MGDIADMMLNGDICQFCGEILDGCGFPQVCPRCQDEDGIDKYGNPKKDSPTVRRKVKCPQCGKRVWESGLAQHKKDKHDDIQSVEVGK